MMSKMSHLTSYPLPNLGDTCEIDFKDDCEGIRCENGGRCRDRPGNYVCECPAKWNGRRCTELDPTFPGGEGKDVPQTPKVGTDFWSKCSMKTKDGHACIDVFRDKICNPECNVEEVRVMRFFFVLFSFFQ